MKYLKVIIVIVILALIIGAALYLGFRMSNKNEEEKEEAIVAEDINPTEGVAKVELSGVVLSIADVTLSNNRDQVTNIRILVEPLEESASRNWQAKPFLKKNGVKEAVHTEHYASLKFDKISTASKVTIDNFNTSYWDPRYVATGDYILGVEIINKNTGELLATITKQISMKTNAPKIQ